MALGRLWRTSRSSPEQAPAAFIHEIYGDRYWQLPGGLFKGIIAGFLWPIALAWSVILFTRRNGAVIRNRTGKGVARQIGEQIGLAARHSIAPFWYYMFELYDDERRKAADLYLTAHETIGPAYELLQPSEEIDALADKVWFAGYCRARGIEAVPVLFFASRGAIAPIEGQAAVLPDAGIFVKPRWGNGGHNAERWDYAGNDSYRDGNGRVLSRSQLLQKLAVQSLKQDYVVQPRLTNHPAFADLSNDALSTARVLTFRNEAGEFEATNAAFRMAIGSNNVVDNFHQGGIATPVDMATGEIDAATDMGTRPQVGWCEAHPVSGAPIRGRKLPFWQEALDLACQAHAAFPQRAVIGWDVAMLPDGPCIIEGNGKPDLDIHQRVERRPLGDQRIARLLVQNIKEALARPRTH